MTSQTLATPIEYLNDHPQNATLGEAGKIIRHAHTPDWWPRISQVSSAASFRNRCAVQESWELRHASPTSDIPSDTCFPINDFHHLWWLWESKHIRALEWGLKTIQDLSSQFVTYIIGFYHEGLQILFTRLLCQRELLHISS